MGWLDVLRYFSAPVPRRFTRRMTLELLEERIVLDAAVDTTVHSGPDQHGDDAQPSNDSPCTTPDSISTSGGPSVAKGSDPATSSPAFVDAKTVAAQTPVSPGVHQAEGPSTTSGPLQDMFASDVNVILVADSLAATDLVGEASAPNSIVISYDGAHGTLAGITDTLADVVASQNRTIDHLALMTHGSEGRLELSGSAVFTANTVVSSSAQWETLGSLLSGDARIDLYGCNVGSGEQGSALVAALARATGATVWASDDATGSTGSADWELEVRSAISDMPYLLDGNGLGALESYLASPTIVNGSFEIGNYSGWTMIDHPLVSGWTPSNHMYGWLGTFGIAYQNETIQPGVFLSLDDPTQVTNPYNDYADQRGSLWGTAGVPQLTPGIDSAPFSPTDGDYSAYLLQNYNSNQRLYQTLTLDDGAESLHWDMKYTNCCVTGFVDDGGDPGSGATDQFLAVSLYDSSGTVLLQDLFKTNPGASDSISMTHFSANISAYRGETVTLTIEVAAENGLIATGLDNFVIHNAPTTTGMPDLYVQEDASPSTIDLSRYFSDVETAHLTYTVASLSNPGLFSSTPIGGTYSDQLTLNYAANQFGSSEVVIRAADADPLTADVTANFFVTVDSVNDGPVNQVPGSQPATEDTALFFNAGNSNLIAISDVDAGTSNLQVQLSVSNGTLTLSGTGGLTFTSGDGSGDPVMAFTGSLNNINAALDGLRFDPTLNWNGSTSLQVVSNDLGNTGSGGAKNDYDWVSITVAAVNDAPTTGDLSVSGNEDASIAVTGWVFGDAADQVPGGSSSDSPAYVKVVDLPLNGTLYLDAAAISAGQSIPWADAGDGSVTFTGTANWNGATSFHYQVIDSGGATSVSANAHITAGAIHDAPSAAGGELARGNENTTFAVTSWGFSDAVDQVSGGSSADSLASVRVFTLPQHGTLKLDGVNIFQGQVINATDTGDGSVTFTPDADWVGSTSYYYSVTDTGGQESNQASGALIVNDPPTLSLGTGGSLDLTFNGTGKVVTTVGPSADVANAAAIQSDGKIVVAGYAYNGSNNDFAAVRYNADGSLDTTFDFEGKVNTPVGASGDYGRSLAIQSDGKIVVAGYSNVGGNSDFSVVRYNSNGSLDDEFNYGGTVTTSISTGLDEANAVAIQTDGKIVVAGDASISSKWRFAVVRYTSDGSLDPTFSGDGKLVTVLSTNDHAYGVAIQTDGKIVVAGSSYNGSNNDFSVARYNSDGTLDTTFDTDGKAITAVGSGDDFGRSVAIQSDGKILVAGYASIGTNNDFAVVRYNSDGSLDTTFDGDGKLTTTIGTADDNAYSVVVQPDGKIVVGGSSNNGTDNDFAVVRYNPDGSLDATLDGDGRLTTAVGSSDDNGASVAIQPDGKIVAAGSAWTASADDFAVVRYDTGHLDYTTGSGAQVLDSGVTITDATSDTMSSATIQITGNYHSDQDSLSIAPGDLLSGVTASWDSGTGKLTLTGAASEADYESMLRHIRFTDSSGTPDTSVRTLTWIVNDDGGLPSEGQASTIRIV
ncbi:MAG: DUF4347 domain-containing protein [Thermodesulfobacteriota bacterium]